MVIPVGDLWDVIAEGDEPFTEGTRLQFENAKKLWTQKLLPLLERPQGVSWQELQEGAADPDAALALRNDARLLKTLLLAALVPEVEALKALIPSRLAALNHGSVRSPLAGREGGIVQHKLRQWAAEVGEIKITEDLNPVITLQITGVDTERSWPTHATTTTRAIAAARSARCCSKSSASRRATASSRVVRTCPRSRPTPAMCVKSSSRERRWIE